MRKFLAVIIFSFLFNGISFSNEKVWSYEGKYLTEECFVNEWISSDNFEEFYDRYSPAVMEAYNSITSEMSDKQKINFFFQGIGNYYVKYIPLDEKFEASWGKDKLSLTRNLNECAKDKIFNIDKKKRLLRISNEQIFRRKRVRNEMFIDGFYNCLKS